MTEETKKTIQLMKDGKFIGEIQDAGDNLKNVEAFEQYTKDNGIGMEPEPTQAIKLQAFAFGRLAISLHDNYLRSPITNNQEAGLFADNAILFVVNGSFAIELFLKTLHMIHCKSTKSGHELQHLFNELPGVVQTTIKHAANDFMIKHHIPHTDTSLLLSEINKAFVEWRYLHEGNKENKPRSFPILNVLILLNALSLVCIADSGQTA